MYRKKIGYNSRSINFQVMHNIFFLFLACAGVIGTVNYYFQMNILEEEIAKTMTESRDKILTNRLEATVDSLSKAQAYFTYTASTKAIKLATLFDQIPPSPDSNPTPTMNCTAAQHHRELAAMQHDIEHSLKFGDKLRAKKLRFLFHHHNETCVFPPQAVEQFD